ncbi:hypothetical protein GCM10010260_65000 [Streptomyces filipinensis]|uniref:Uncharacterized protein n=1 Tax=Streptomyces filipinensis TaxID=66887 RepID=A0A918II94_9ACTN|nr:hypothetical protein GCM10010260_65000 [Streptomyces filipinensis]
MKSASGSERQAPVEATPPVWAIGGGVVDDCAHGRSPSSDTPASNSRAWKRERELYPRFVRSFERRVVRRTGFRNTEKT